MYYEDTPPNTFTPVDPSVFPSERDGHSVLAFFACSDAVAMMSDIVRHLFAGKKNLPYTRIPIDGADLIINT